jgi:hypothetical protein
MIYKPIFLLLGLCCLLLTCKGNKNVPPIEQLPPETQTGAMTFGCLINGEAFTPKGSVLGAPALLCAYQFIRDNLDEGYFFQLSAHNFSIDKSVGIFTDSLEIEQGKKYELTKPFTRGKASGKYVGKGGDLDEILFQTDSQAYKGELWIKKFDNAQSIVSGTFWFDAVNEKGEKVEVREGRFDVRFSR